MTTRAAHDPVPTAPRGVLLANPRGYCAGVDRAVRTVERALELNGAPVYVRRQIVHNAHVVRTLEEQGAVFVEEATEVPEGSVLVLSAHGVAPGVHVEAAERSLTVIDATCPLVTKVHLEARRFAAEGLDVVLVGHEGHEEVVGTSGQAPGRTQVVSGVDEVSGIQVEDPRRVGYLSQTTLSVTETEEVVAALKERFPDLQAPPSSDICYATTNRQEAVRALAARADLVLVVGSANSSNSVRLVEVALLSGAGAAHLVEDAESLRTEWLEGVTTVGVTSGASVPEELVEGVLARLAEHGHTAREEVAGPEESVTFALPHGLRALERRGRQESPGDQGASSGATARSRDSRVT